MRKGQITVLYREISVKRSLTLDPLLENCNEGFRISKFPLQRCELSKFANQHITDGLLPLHPTETKSSDR